MKRIIYISILLLTIVACKKTKFAPEGPTDVRIRNQSDVTFNDVIISTSEYEADKDTIQTILNGTVSEYSRFTKAYPKAEISAKINVGGTLLTFTTGPVDFTYMQYIGQDMITFEVYIPNMNTRELKINNVVFDSPLVLK